MIKPDFQHEHLFVCFLTANVCIYCGEHEGETAYLPYSDPETDEILVQYAQKVAEKSRF